jgi:hypothetical protein
MRTAMSVRSGGERVRFQLAEGGARLRPEERFQMSLARQAHGANRVRQP